MKKIKTKQTQIEEEDEEGNWPRDWKVEGGGGTESIWWHSSATWVGPPPSSSSSPLLSSKSQKTDGLGISQIRSQTNAFFLCLSLFGHTKHCYSMPTMEWKLYLFIFWLILIWCANKTQLSLSLSKMGKIPSFFR